MEDIEELRKGFDFTTPCLRRWELSRSLRKLGIQGRSLVQSEKGDGKVPPSLTNLRLNYELLKGYTGHMAETGIICTRLIEPLKPPLLSFYELMEIDVSKDRAISMVHGVAANIKKMLGTIRSKWRRWEMPRESRSESIEHTFGFLTRFI